MILIISEKQNGLLPQIHGTKSLIGIQKVNHMMIYSVHQLFMSKKIGWLEHMSSNFKFK